MPNASHAEHRVSTGIQGLDDVLGGGLPSNRLYLVEGEPGTGKTTTAMQFLLEGARAGERVLFISLSENVEELRAIAASHGWNLDGVNIFELSEAQQTRSADQNTLFHPSEVELNEVTQVLLDEVERVHPTRVVLDSLSELRLLSQHPLRFRRQILALKQHFIGKNVTVILLDDRDSSSVEALAHSIAHGVIDLEQLAPEYGSDRRRLRVKKLRGVQFRGGYHDFIIARGGLKIFPRLIASEHHGKPQQRIVTSGVAEIDTLLGDGLLAGTSMLIMGPAGSGKSTIAMQYLQQAAANGERCAAFLFDENIQTMLVRSDAIGLNLRQQVSEGKVVLRQIDPAEVPPGEFVQLVRDEVEKHQTKLIIIDSLNGYMHAMPAEKYLTLHLHELLMYLSQCGVMTIMVMAQHGMMGRMESQVDISYLSDTVVMLRYFEAYGVIRVAMSVVKKRTGRHERTIREMMITPTGIHVGKPLSDFQGVLSGVPTYVGKDAPLMDSDGK